MRSWTGSSILFVSVLLLALCQPRGARCSWEAMPEARFFPLTDEIRWANSAKLTREEKNIEEWRKYLGPKTKTVDVRLAVYETTESELQALLDGAAGGAGDSPALAAARKLLGKPEKREALAHLVLAKRAEPYMSEEYDRTLHTGYPALAAAYAELYKTSRSDFIKGRIGYQLTRLARYSGEFESAIGCYDRYLPPKLKAGRARWWALEHKASSLRKTDRKEEANLLYVKIAANASELRGAASLYFDVRSDAEWARLMKACGSDAERASAHALRALNSSANRLEEMKAIYKLDPSNSALPEIIAREVRWIEHTYGGSREFAGGEPLFAGGIGKAITEDVEFLGAALSGSRVANPDLWRLALGYLARLAGTQPAGKEGKVGDPNLLAYSRMLDFLADIALFEKPDDARAMELLARLDTVEKLGRQLFSPSPAKAGSAFAEWEFEAAYWRASALRTQFFRRVGGVYGRAGNRAVEALCTTKTEDYGALLAFWQRRDEKLAEAFEKLFAKAERTEFENALLDGGSQFAPSGSIDVWRSIAGGSAMGEGRYDDAMALFGRIRDANQLMLYFDPFEVRTRDYVKPPAAPVTDKITVARRMKELRAAAEGGGLEAGRALLKLGTASYNISYFGRSWSVLSPYRSVTMIDEMRQDDRWFDLAPAVRYLMRAEELLRDAEPELAARCAFMLAKCKGDKVAEVKGFAEGHPLYRTMVGEQTQKLKTVYANTEFAKLALKECKLLGE